MKTLGQNYLLELSPYQKKVLPVAGSIYFKLPASSEKVSSGMEDVRRDICAPGTHRFSVTRIAP
jgi:hypothetical protein